MDEDGNLSALNKYLEQQQAEEDAYEELLEALRNEEDPGEWDDIIESMGWGDADHIQILEDI